MLWIKAFSCKKFDFLNPDPASICIEEIACVLSNICRFTGHLETMYSIAQYSVLLSELVPVGLALEALLHNGSEACCNDISSPLKTPPEYREIEGRTQTAINHRFGIYTLKPPDKACYLIMLSTEMRDLGEYDTDEKSDPVLYPPTSFIIKPVDSLTA
ncbi:HD family hydrolase [Klebsiella oxytoca]|uniref:HD family hydrolase n=1 Tax=Klebsiella oxytoca TaxID=571 RepID=A0AAP2BI50_KLEOX|nr:HD family hydrolase [Klebsiella oxytoca]MBQ0600784.1 HD family hydrolase [Klebsiella oxytoca]